MLTNILIISRLETIFIKHKNLFPLCRIVMTTIIPSPFLFKWINFSMSRVQNKVSFLNSAQSMFCDRHRTSVVQPDNNRVQVCETDDCNYCALNNSIYKGNRYKSKNFREKFRSSRKLQMWSKTNCGLSNKLQQSEKDQRGKIESTSEWKWNGRFRFLLHFPDSGSLLGLMSMKHSHSLLHLFNSATSHQVNILCCTWHKRDHFRHILPSWSLGVVLKK